MNPGVNVAAARRSFVGFSANCISRDEIREVLLQTAIYCGVPAANSAFKQAREVFAALDKEDAR